MGDNTQLYITVRQIKEIIMNKSRLLAGLAFAAAAVLVTKEVREKEELIDEPVEELLTEELALEEEKEEETETPDSVNSYIGDWVWSKVMINDSIDDAEAQYGSIVTHINEDGTVYNNDVKIGIWQKREDDLVVVSDSEDQDTIATVDGVHIALCGFDEDNNLIMVATMDEKNNVGKILCVRAEEE